MKPVTGIGVGSGVGQSADAGPEKGFSKDREKNIGANAQSIRVGHREDGLVVDAVIGIVDPAANPFAGAVGTQASEHSEAEKGTVTERGIPVFEIDEGHASGVIRPSEPYDFPAEFIPARSNLHPDPFIRMQPYTDGRGFLGAGRPCRTERHPH